jgi:hypothetical protein
VPTCPDLHGSDICLSGASRDRTGDLLLAKQALSQLSYGPRSSNIRPLTQLASLNTDDAEPPLLVEVEVARWALLEPKAILLRSLAQEVGRFLEDILHRLVLRAFI